MNARATSAGSPAAVALIPVRIERRRGHDDSGPSRRSSGAEIAEGPRALRRPSETPRRRQAEGRAELRAVDAASRARKEIELLVAGPDQALERLISRILAVALDGRDGRLGDAGAGSQRALGQAGMRARRAEDLGGPHLIVNTISLGPGCVGVLCAAGAPAEQGRADDISVPPKTVAARIETRILVIRGERVMLDADLAALYGVPTGRLNEAVRRNRARFPNDFMFQLS